jgi:hypothetical protein
LLWAFQREKFWNNIYKTKQGFANETNLSVLITIIRLVLLWLGEPNHDEAQSFQVRKGQLRFLFECAIISAFEALRFVCMTEEQPYHQLHDICEKVLFKFNFMHPAAANWLKDVWNEVVDDMRNPKDTEISDSVVNAPTMAFN